MGSLSEVEAVTVDRLVAWLSAFRDAVHEHGAYLTELDSAIGDADHGANLIRGMDAVMAAVEPPPGNAGDLLKKVGMTLVTSVGGASGPLYGTFFLRAATAVGDATEPMLALKGRASYLGERSVGHVDPGAASSALLLAALADTLES